MTTVTHSRYTDPEGQVVHQALVNGYPATQPDTDERWIATHARALYQGSRGPARLVFWDGDAKKETLLEEKR